MIWKYDQTLLSCSLRTIALGAKPYDVGPFPMAHTLFDGHDFTFAGHPGINMQWSGMLAHLLKCLRILCAIKVSQNRDRFTQRGQ